MGLLTIGAFAHAAELTPKALRLYDEKGLLPPTAVDPESGYRYYGTDQLGQARLIARLRHLGMPLAEISSVCRLDPAEAAAAIDTYWQRVVADTTARGRLATFLVDQLSGRGTTMSNIDVRYATRCERGSRDSNEDTAYASDRLLAVADGVRGPGGAAASAAAIDVLASFDVADATASELLTMLADAVAEADTRVRDAATDDHQPITTLTALLRSGTQLALVHIGDTRLYLLRGGELFQLTQDHTYVQSLVDQGKLNRDEAAAHRQRALLARALGASAQPVEADLALRTALPGDRYLLCSDGLSAVATRTELVTTLAADTDPEDVVQALVNVAHDHGAPDNIACVVADVVAA